MKKIMIIVLVLMIFSCKGKTDPTFTAQKIIDKSIIACGGDLYRSSNISFDFRDRTYIMEGSIEQRVLKRIYRTDTSVVTDVKRANNFQRYVNDRLVNLPDSISDKYANSINSVHYFAYLPYGLNDLAVNKCLLGKAKIKGKEYFKVRITFTEEGGGKDFEDTYIYWFDTTTFKPDYLAYEFQDDGGGMRFREAYNERYINGIRFVDYNNFLPKNTVPSIFRMDSLFNINQLKLLSTIELRNINVRPDNYN